MVLALIFVLALVSCSSFELDNPNDPRNKSSSSAESSSSEWSSSSEDSSSSGEQESSSSGLVSSSSGELPSSSSGVVSSSSSTGCTAADNNEVQYCSNGTIKHYGSVTYGSQPYKTVEIGNQIWMAENLNYAIEDVGVSVCYGSNIDSNCVKYGRLYSNETAIDICNKSYNYEWRLPNNDDWMGLAGYLSSSAAGKHLKATSGWNSNGNGEDTYGFAALPGGSGSSKDGQNSFSNVGNYGYWWSSPKDYFYMSYNKDILESSNNNNNNNSLFSVRCMKDNEH